MLYNLHLHINLLITASHLEFGNSHCKKLIMYDTLFPCATISEMVSGKFIYVIILFTLVQIFTE
jgi:hypothetical protein